MNSKFKEEMMAHTYKQFTQLYPVSKTLRFELKPAGETASHIENFKSHYLKEVVSEDKQRAEHYKVVKEIIDDYHRAYIEEKLSQPVDTSTGEMWVTPEHLEAAYCDYQNLKKESSEPKLRDAWSKVQEGLRKNVVKAFSNNGDLFKKELITRDLPALLKQQNKWEETKEAVESFNKFTTYFSGFHDNRKNMYSDKAHSTAIAYRLMNENLPRFFNNYISYQKIKEKQPEFDFNIEIKLLKKMGVTKLDDIFQPRYFINLFTQSGLDNYQTLLGGKTNDTGKKTQGLNEKINLYNQQQLDKKDKLPKFVSLYKQILSDRETHSFIPEEFTDDASLLKALQDYIEHTTADNGELQKLETAVQLLSDANTKKVYVKTAGLADISTAIFRSYGIIGRALWHHAETERHPNPTKKDPTKALLKKRADFCKQTVFSIVELDDIVTRYIDQLELSDPLHQQLAELSNPTRPIYNYFLSALQQVKQEHELDSCIRAVTPLLTLKSLSKKRQAPTAENEQGSEGYQQRHKIQKMLDAYMAISHALKPLHLVNGRSPIDMPDMDTGFYTDFSARYEAYSDALISLYNKTRNHLTKKPFSKDKIKLNFGIPTLLKGWDANKESDNASLIFEKNGLYYLGIMHPKHKQLFSYIKGIDDISNEKKTNKKDALRQKVEAEKGQEGYRKIVYKLLPGANKMLPKVFFSNSRQEYFSPSDDVLQIRNTASHSKNGMPQKGYKKADFNINDCHTLIDFFKASIEKHPEWKAFNFKFSPTQNYQDISDFYREVEQQGYKVDFHSIKKIYIDECIEQGKLFLFQIYNKDFSPYSKGKPNLHTLYWKGLFEPENLKDVVLKLNGDAEIFYRQHSIKQDDIIIHRANEAINNKNDKNPKKESTFDYDIIKDKRYTQDKFQFHVPITLNFKAQGVTRFNDKVNQVLQEADDTHVIGIDRGERHLLYYTVVNSKGVIVEQDTLNTINTDQGYKVDYQQKLHTKEKEREKARKSWSSVENIKELKSGYLSHVVHKLAELIIKYNAIVCLEDLNFGFKRGRFHVEKQVYQKFEKALIDKLNYMVFKSNDLGMAGHYLNAYQLTAPFESFEKLGKQSGILFYVQAAYTSKIDPATGFIDFLRPKYESLAKSKDFFEKIDSFYYNAEKDYFEFSFDYKKFKVSQKFGQYQTHWTVCTFGDLRYSNKRNDKGGWDSLPINVTAELKQLFDNANIDYQQGQDLKQSLILAKETKFYKTLFWLLRLTLSLRHSVTGTDEDFILSPVANEKGEFFDSRQATETMPKDADANGAYNIALKGLWNLQQIKQWDGESALKLAMSNEDWFSYVSTKPYTK